MNVKTLLLACGSTLAAVAVAVVLRGPFDTVEDDITSLKFTIRGSRTADSSIVLAYIDDEAIKTFGWPVRRNFYALTVKALTDLKVRAIGIEVLFEDPKPEYAEYDQLLAGVVRGAGNVVLSSYLGAIPGASESHNGAIAALQYPAITTPLVSGSHLHLPIQPLLKSAAGIGHLNFIRDTDIPVVVGSSSGVVPSFALEVLRVASGCSRGDVTQDDHRITLLSGSGTRVIPLRSDGCVSLNFPGPISSYSSYPLLEVIRSYDALRSDRAPSVPVARLKDKIVLVGVIAEGRSQFFHTPVDLRMPSLAVQAAFIDNALHDTFLRTTGPVTGYILCGLIGLLAAFSILFLPSPWNITAGLGLPVLFGAVSVALFLTSSIIVPVAAPMFTGVFAAVVPVIYRHRRMSEAVGNLEAERSSIAGQLRDREAKLSVLERELVEAKRLASTDRTAELLDEIRRHKAEIRQLSSKADDMVAYSDDESGDVPAEAVFEGVVYDRNGKMKPIVEFVEKIAPSDAAVLILGESGTGKELIARAIHKRSPRSKGPFIAVNCSALSESLLESELFGHERGAFTGAVKERAGRFELAHDGTIFLDEIGEVSESFQRKLLRVLQEGELERVGGTITVKVNVRLVAATNKDLKAEVAAKRFREDLYYRINVLSVALPPLRNRESDIPLLVNHFLMREGAEMHTSRNVMEIFRQYRWSGNVRELESAIKRAVLLARAEGRTMISVKDVTDDITRVVQNSIPVEDQVLDLLREKGFARSSVSEAADELGGLNRGTVAEYLRGECLKAFVENVFAVDKAVAHVSLSADEQVNARVRKRFDEYLSNIAEAVDPSQPWDAMKVSLRPKMKNLPQRYHVYVEQAAEAYYRRVWKINS